MHESIVTQDDNLIFSIVSILDKVARLAHETYQPNDASLKIKMDDATILALNPFLSHLIFLDLTGGA